MGADIKYCAICGSDKGFSPRFRDGSQRDAVCEACGASRRNSDTAAAILEKAGVAPGVCLTEARDQLKNLAIVNFSSDGAIHKALSGLPNYTATDYFEDIAPGRYKRAKDGSLAQSQDLHCLTFADNSFDLAISEDVFEHLRDPWLAFAEVSRILKPGGSHIFTIPYHSGRATESRYETGPDGSLRNRLPLVVHSDPLRRKGIPVITDFGDDLPLLLGKLGIVCQIALDRRFYEDSRIPLIHSRDEERRYRHFFDRGQASRFFLYNSVVFRAEKSAAIQAAPAGIRLAYQKATVPFQPGRLTAVPKDARAEFVRGETVHFAGRPALMIDIGLTGLPPIILVETFIGDLVTLVLPESLNDVPGLAEFLENEVVPLLKKLPPDLARFHVDGQGRYLEWSGPSERMVPGRSPYFTSIAHLRRYDFVRSRLPDKCANILDIGCGEGYGLAMLAEKAGCRGVGTDISPETIEADKVCYPGLEWLQKDSESLVDDPALAGRFDVVTCFEHIEHLKNPENCLQAIGRALAPGGKAYISVPNHVWEGFNPFHKADFSLTRAEALLAKYFNKVKIYSQNDQSGASLDNRFPVTDTRDDRAQFWIAECAEPALARCSPSPRRKVSIIIPLFNRADYTKKAIDAIYANTPDILDWELVLVDNGSTDETCDLQPKDERMRIFRNPENYGFAKASNQGAILASGEILVFLNNDTQVRRGWLEPLIDELEKNPGTGLAGSRLLYPDGSIQHAGVVIGRDQIPYHIHRGRAGNDPLVMQRRAFPVLTGACLAARKDEFMAIGMFDEEFVNGHEDIDLCFRYRQKGQNCVYRPDSCVIHYESVSDGRMDSRPRNLERTFAKWRQALIQDDFSYRIPAVSRRADSLRFAIKIGTPTRGNANWGDIYYAESLAKELVRAGHSCVIHYLSEWGKEDSDIDVVIHLKGLSRYYPKPWNLNIMWMLNHPDLHTTEELNGYDAICVASEAWAEKLRNELAVPVFTLHQATDPDAFRKLRRIPKKYDVVFVGNNYGAGREDIRKMVSWLFDAPDTLLPFNLAVWGEGWRGKIPEQYIRGNFIKWEDLPEVYNSARIVLNDHQETMALNGFVNNRTFDVAACGVPLLSDKVDGLASLLAISQCSGSADLRQAIRRLLANPGKASALAEKNRQKTLANFTFAKRAEELGKIIRDIDKGEAQKRIAESRARILDRQTRTHGPLVSVLMSTHNRRLYLPQAIRSVIAQTYQDWELWIVRDGGDEIGDIVASFSDSRIHLIDLAENVGKGAAINRAFARSSGEYIAYLDDDDTWRPDHLERLTLALRFIPGIGMAYSDAERVDIDESLPGPWQETGRSLKYMKQVSLGELLENNSITGISVAHKRELFELAGGFDPRLRVLIDFDMWRRLACFSYPYHVSYITADYYLRSNSAAKHITNLFDRDKLDYARNRLKLLWKKIPLPDELTDTAERLKAKSMLEYYIILFDRAKAAGDHKKVEAVLKAANKFARESARVAYANMLLQASHPEEALAIFKETLPIGRYIHGDLFMALLVALTLRDNFARWLLARLKDDYNAMTDSEKQLYHEYEEKYENIFGRTQ